MNQEIAVAPNLVNSISERCHYRRSLESGDAVDKPNGAGIFLYRDSCVMLLHMLSEHSLKGREQPDKEGCVQIVNGPLKILGCSLLNCQRQILPTPLIPHILERSIHCVMFVTYSLEKSDVEVAHGGSSSPL